MASIDPNILEVMEKCNFIAEIPVNHKLDIINMRYLDADSWFTSIYRTFYWRTENSEVLKKYINGTINDAINILAESKDLTLCRLILNSLASTKKGLSHLAETYNKTPKIKSWIAITIINIDKQLTDNEVLFNEKYPGANLIMNDGSNDKIN